VTTRIAKLVLATMAAAWMSGSLVRAEKPVPVAANASDAALAERFFETRVRPMLAQRCFACHGPEKQEAGLRLDSRQNVLKGSETDKVVVPGEPDKSRLIAAVRYDGDIQMPPDGKLPDGELATLVAWVRMGVPWAADAHAAVADDMPSRIARAKATHWSLQPVRRPELPKVKDTAWATSAIDRFVLARLEEHGLSASPPADRRTLLRRATYDLTGLPPTMEEVEAFVNDTAADAFAKVIDRLLASPEYGQRWGRHWLDVARYSDTKGYVFTEDRRYPYAYTYRDYVIAAFNADLPYDQFIREQLAADQLPQGEDKTPLAAMGFLTVGRRFSNNQQDIIDDRIDVVTRGLMGLTVTCARCHDHKFDPIASEDYYSLYGVFASSIEPAEPPLIGKPADGEAYAEFTKELAKREAAYKEFRETKHRELLAELRGRVGDYLMQVVVEKDGPPPPAELELSFNAEELRPAIVRRWREYLARAEKQRNPVFVPWHEYAALNKDTFAQGAAAITQRLRAAGDDPAKPINPRVREALVAHPPASMRDVARVYGQVLASTEKAWLELTQRPAPKDGSGNVGGGNAGGSGGKPSTNPPEKLPEKLPDASSEELRQVLYAHGSPAAVEFDDARRIFDRVAQNEITKLRKQVDELKVNSPAAPPRAMTLVDAAAPQEPHVFIRGNANRQGKQVPRQFVPLLCDGPARPFVKGSGRLELAEAIASRANPLTARVLVNRVWQHHFGAPLVRTESDFGLRSEPPSHPKLLDYLAAAFMDEGWSLKRLHRLIMLSSAYQQASGDRPDCRAIDAENRWLWRMNRQRLDFEATRDCILAAAGRLDATLGGRSVNLFAQPYSTRRAVYAFIDRQDLPGLFRIFDFASPDVSTAERPRTTVPQQALFVMNSPFVIEQARHLAERAKAAAPGDPAERVQALYRIALARAADPEEVELGLRFVAAASAGSAAGSDGGAAAVTTNTQPAASSASSSAWNQYAQALLLTNEFMFVD
jgi:Protein of unknown function (DUF1553)/Protein of unknown function (DUF1549)/Planctomycete cytochrome C